MEKCFFPLLDLRSERGQFEQQCQNDQIVEMLSRLIDLAKQQRADSKTPAVRTQHTHRITSFTRALESIKGHPVRITSGREAKELPGVGKGIADRIDTYLATGTLPELESAVDPKARTIMELTSVTGIGEARAKTLVELGVTGVADLIRRYKSGELRVAKNQLTHHMAVGLDFYNDLQLRIPWIEVDQIRQFIEEIAAQLSPDLQIEVCGSYRRMRPTCGDIDVLLTHPDNSVGAHYLSKLVANLSDTGFLVGHLTEHGETKYMGVCKLDQEGPGRRIDIRFVPRENLAAATLYFTGSGNFNKLMRYKANQRGYTLNEYGLYHYLNGVKGEAVPVRTEEDIFYVLQFVYLEPQLREF